MKTFPKPLSIQEEREYLKRYKEGDLEAREVLINRNLRLVAHVKCPFAVFCQELLYSYRVGIHIIAMKTQCVVRAFPYPGHGIGV